MMTQQPTYTIQQVAAQTGLTVHTLRYYERIGLLLPVERARNGHRRYSEMDIRRIELLNRLRKTGMPLVDMQRYAVLLLQGVESVTERRALLERHRQTVQAEIQALQETLAIIDHKIDNYCALEAQHLHLVQEE
jgi:DNA-binding transcriptional MerR regulator